MTEHSHGKKMQDNSKTKITFGLFISYSLGALSMLTGVLAYSSGSFLGPSFLVLAALVLFPPSRRKMFGALGMELGRWMVAFLFIIIWIAGSVITYG